MKRIPLRRRDGSIRAFAKVDDEDYESLSQYAWHYSHGYVERSFRVGHGADARVKTVSMHRQLLGLIPGDKLEVDHKNGNGLDNRRKNLRAGTRALNRQNLRSYRDSSSAYRGVHWDNSSSRWVAQIKLNGKGRKLGYFKDEVEAGMVAAAARKREMKWTTN
jgi:hypothetical protein